MTRYASHKLRINAWLPILALLQSNLLPILCKLRYSAQMLRHLRFAINHRKN